MGDVLRRVKEHDLAISAFPIDPVKLGGLVALVDKGTISSAMAKDVFAKMFESGRSADEIVAAEGLSQIGDAGALEAIVREVMAANADAVTQYRAGKQQTFGFLVGQVMKASRGKANPQVVNQVLKDALAQEPA